jgi:hypothetical protein
MDWSGSFNAVHDFRDKHKIDTPIIQVYHGPADSLRGVYFLKPNSDKPHEYCNSEYEY